MPLTPVPRPTDVPPFPALSERASGSYNSKAYAFGTHLSGPFNGEIQAVADSAFENASWSQLMAEAAAASASMAAAALEAAEYTTGLTAWVSGKTYQQFEAAISRINYQVYRRTASGSGTVDPANDTTGAWVMRAGAGSFIPQQVPATSIDLSRGNDHYLVINGNRTITFDNCPQDGYSFTLDVDVTAGVLTLPTTARTQNNVSYVLTAGKGHSLMFRTRNRGARWRLVAATNFDL